jgi:putative transposase
MRRPRLKAPASHPFALYHCISRVVNRDYILETNERNQFRRFMREYETFCGVRVRTYCILSNHFHLLVEVPARPKTLPDPEVLLQRLAALTCAGRSVEGVRQQIQTFRDRGDAEGEKAFWERFCAPMWDVSQFMKLLKQRFSQWYNRTHKRKGTLWEERFCSVLLEPGSAAELTMTTYIDLNPVRAKMVKDPMDYPWCGYAEALAVGGKASEGLMRVMREEDPQKALEGYRMLLFGLGEQGREGTDAQGQPLRAGIPPEQVDEVLAKGGKLSGEERRMVREKYLTEGKVLGSLAFVEEVTKGMIVPGRKGSRPRRAVGSDEELYYLGWGKQ